MHSADLTFSYVYSALGLWLGLSTKGNYVHQQIYLLDHLAK